MLPDQEAQLDDPGLLGRLQAEGRRRLWNNTAAFLARAIAKYLDGPFEKLAQDQAIRASPACCSTRST